MNQACVSLEEVFAAAAGRAASLVPETSGYLTLAVADATSRLPYQHDDRAVLLTVDGSVMVPRKTTIVASTDAARSLRDVLRRLLATSTGSMPGLAAAARPRGDEHDVDQVVADIEAALIPVNRAAAKRALARLARETLRAKETGKLRKKPSQAPAARPQPTAAPTTIAHATAAAATAPVAAPVAPAPAEVLAPIHQPPQAVAEIAPPPFALAPPREAPPPPAPHARIPPPPFVIVFASETPTPPPRADIPQPPLAADETPAPLPHIDIPPPPLVVTTAGLDVDHETTLAATHALAVIEVAALHDDDHVEEPDAAWHDPDATIADPDAMAVLEAHDDSATVAGALVAEKDELPAGLEDEHAEEEDDALTRPWQPDVAPIVPAPVVASPDVAATTDIAARAAIAAAATTPAAASSPAAPGRIETVRLETPTAAAPQAVMFSEPAGTRADELLDAFHAQDHSDAVLAAARGLRAFTGVDLTPPPRPAPPRGPAKSAAPLSKRPLPPPMDDDDASLPLPRVRGRAGSRWPLAIFTVGVLVLFAAWLYRPTLAQSFFGLRDIVLPRPASVAAPQPPSQPSPPPPEATPEPVTADPGAPAAPARPREARAGDGAQRRRD